MALISCEHATIGYENQIAVNDVSFSLDEGDYLCILGQNGSGKSTLMKGILKLLPLQKGTIVFQGLSQTEIGYLPQQTMIQRDFPASVQEVVLSGCLNQLGLKPFYSKVHRRLAEEKMEELGIMSFKKKSYRDLSGGQQQRVLLARALCATNKLLLLDEPVAGLDPLVTAEFYALVHNLNRKKGISVIMVSHDIPGVMQSATKILQMGTKALFYGTPETYAKSNIGKMMMGGNADDFTIS